MVSGNEGRLRQHSGFNRLRIRLRRLLRALYDVHSASRLDIRRDFFFPLGRHTPPAWDDLDMYCDRTLLCCDALAPFMLSNHSTHCVS